MLEFYTSTMYPMLSLIGLIFFIPIILYRRKVKKKYKCTCKTVGVIIGVEESSSESTSYGSEMTHTEYVYGAKVQYTVNNFNYTVSEYHKSSQIHFSRGDKVFVYYNPQRPSESILGSDFYKSISYSNILLGFALAPQIAYLIFFLRESMMKWYVANNELLNIIDTSTQPFYPPAGVFAFFFFIVLPFVVYRVYKRKLKKYKKKCTWRYYGQVIYDRDSMGNVIKGSKPTFVFTVNGQTYQKKLRKYPRLPYPENEWVFIDYDNNNPEFSILESDLSELEKRVKTLKRIHIVMFLLGFWCMCSATLWYETNKVWIDSDIYF